MSMYGVRSSGSRYSPKRHRLVRGRVRVRVRHRLLRDTPRVSERGLASRKRGGAGRGEAERGGARRGEASGVARPREGVRGGSSSERSYSSPRAILTGVLGFARLAVVSDVEEGGDLHGTCTCTLCMQCALHAWNSIWMAHAWLMQCRVCAVLARRCWRACAPSALRARS